MTIEDAVKILLEFKDAQATWGTPLVPKEIQDAIVLVCSKVTDSGSN